MYTAHRIRERNEWQSKMLNKRISLSYVLGNVYDINDDQEGQVPSLEMPCNSSEFHYTELRQRQSHCAAAAQHWPFRTHHPEEMPISNIYWHSSILMCRCQQSVGECHRAENTEVFSDMFCFSVTSCNEKSDTPKVLRSKWGDFECFGFESSLPVALSSTLWSGYPESQRKYG